MSLGETTVTRPWQWGMAVLGDPAAALPERPGSGLVAIATGAVVLRLRHAQDTAHVDGAATESTATVHVRVLDADEPVTRTVLCDVVLETPSGRLSLGDAAEAITVETTGATRHRVLVTAEAVRATGLDEVWVDVVPVEAAEQPAQ